MGGNALKNTYTRRYSKIEYESITKDVVDMIISAFPLRDERYIKPILSFSDKETFGDLDVLHCIDNLDVDTIRKLFSPNEIVLNGEVISFDYKEFQIDLIKTTEQKFDYAFNYFAYNDMGNLIGRIFKKLGLKHGHEGLLYVLRDKDHVIAEIPITRNYRQALEIVGLVPRYDFKNLEQIFQYVASSPYFSPKIYLFDNMNHRSRVRDAKRETYNKFLAWCDKTYKGTSYVFTQEDKCNTLNLVFQKYPEFRSRYESELSNYNLQKEIKLIFNGNIVMSVTGLSGKELGAFMTSFRDCHKLETMLDYTPKQIEQLIRKHQNKLYNERNF